MAKLTILFGGVLILLGLGAYLAAEVKSMTALIPAFFGIVFALIGALALKPAWSRIALPVAAGLAVLAFLGPAFMGLPKLPALLRGDELERPAAVASQSIMALVCLAFLIALGVLFAKACRGSPQLETR